MIVNWLSVPTAVGQATASVAGMFAGGGELPGVRRHVPVHRRAGDGCTDRTAVVARPQRPAGAVRNAAIALALAAVLSPTTLPWYLSWGFCLLAMTPWSARGLQWVVFGSIWLMIVYFPDGETALYVPHYLLACALAGVLAAVSLLRPDPLGLRRSTPSPPRPCARDRARDTARDPARDRRPPAMRASAAERAGRVELDAAGLTDPQLRAAYAACRALHAEHGRTYFLATRLLPPERRVDIHALYGFARFADEIVDDPDGAGGGDPHTPARRARRRAGGRAGGRTAARQQARGLAVAETARRHDLDASLFRDFMVSMRMDLTVTDYATDDELAVYVHGSAAVIGLQTLPVLGTVVPRARRSRTPRCWAWRSRSRTSCATSARTSTAAGCTCPPTSSPRSGSTGSCWPGAGAPGARTRGSAAPWPTWSPGPGPPTAGPIRGSRCWSRCRGPASAPPGAVRGDPRRDRRRRLRRADPPGRGAEPAPGRRRAAPARPGAGRPRDQLARDRVHRAPAPDGPRPAGHRSDRGAAVRRPWPGRGA